MTFVRPLLRLRLPRGYSLRLELICAPLVAAEVSRCKKVDGCCITHSPCFRDGHCTGWPC